MYRLSQMSTSTSWIDVLLIMNSLVVVVVAMGCALRVHGETKEIRTPCTLSAPAVYCHR